jgi:myo-inositol-1(or 4)-monophosphatase
MTTILDFAAQLAGRAGAFLRERFELSGAPAARKPDRTVVTEADLAVDRLIAAAIREAYPEDQILSEELQTTFGPDQLPTWVIDPLDGTTNFSLGIHHWGVSIARLVNGWPDTAALYFPLLDELYTAQRGQGAALNGERIHARPPVKDRPAAFFSCCTRTHREYSVSVPYKTRILGTAAYSLCLVARGAALLSFEATPKLWDLAAAWLVVEEAGGQVEMLAGGYPFPARPGFDYSGQNFPTVGAATPELIGKARQWITPR